ncbi:MaoC family dehydratase [Aliamphritea hakodatensis]|uniref:MaoC family dehydratase n=1 Tax=Aliamphritea hakodatensis TaxID=2895352 RepID=UPI0022FD52A1|nr:MaoC family dehydratase [Aliamphritea hakodatensis]
MQDLHGYYLEDLEVGMSDSYEKTISEADVNLFAELSGDTNPVHLDEEYAASTPFKQRIVHGMFCGALISTVAGTKLPGPGCIYLDQQIKFKAPVLIGDTAKATGTIEEIDQRRRRVKMRTDVHVGDKLVATGYALLMVDKRG